MKSKKLLVLKHMISQNPGVFRELASSRNIEFTEIDLHAGELIPDLNQFDGLWSMGGSMNVWDKDEFPWLCDEMDFIREAVSKNMPFLGICLGHQLLAEALGGKVEATDNYEIGLHSVSATEHGRDHPLLENIPDPSLWVNVHLAEVTQKPVVAIVLAESEKCPNHIMQVGEFAFSCQFHPEVCEHTVPNWMEIPDIPEALNELLGTEGVSNFHQSIEDYLSQHKQAASQLFDNWLNIVFD